jgi:UV DNA damage endonuclease
VPKPHYGLVCQTHSDECRFRTITRTRLVSLDEPQQREKLQDLYADNLQRLLNALAFCVRHDIRLYRMPTGLFPMSDEPLGRSILKKMQSKLAAVGETAGRESIRVVTHPDQFVVLSSDSPAVVQTGVTILAKEALAMDLMGLPQSPWSAVIIHCGKAGRGEALVATIAMLPNNIRQRLVLENDEYSYGAEEVLSICRVTGVPMVFDNLHHAVHEKLADHGHPSFARLVKAARGTWPDPTWQLVHLSNGEVSSTDRRHSHLIETVPPAYRNVPWIEVEAKGKELAIARLRQRI